MLPLNPMLDRVDIRSLNSASTPCSGLRAALRRMASGRLNLSRRREISRRSVASAANGRFKLIV